MTISKARIGLNGDEAFVELQTAEPPLDGTNKKPCRLNITHAAGNFLVRCGDPVDTAMPVDQFDPAAIERIWRTEGSPKQGWELKLVIDDGPKWEATAGVRTTRYALDGSPA